MTPTQIYSTVRAYAGGGTTIICDLHSACTPRKLKHYVCGAARSGTEVIDFDEVKRLADKALGCGARKSVDALTVAPSYSFLCFIELKSWELVLAYNGSEDNVRRQAKKYSSDLPGKLSVSMRICEEITNDPATFDGCRVIYILLTDIPVDDGLMALNTDLTALAGISSDLKGLCNSLSRGIMAGISAVETRYWECRQFDTEIASL